MSNTPSRALTPQTEVTDALREPLPSFARSVFRFLQYLSASPSHEPQPQQPLWIRTYPPFPPEMDSTFIRTPVLPSEPPDLLALTLALALAGTSAYPVNIVNAFVISLLAFRSNSLRRTGRGLNSPTRETVVPLCAQGISGVSREHRTRSITSSLEARQGSSLTHLPSNPSGTIQHPPIPPQSDDRAERRHPLRGRRYCYRLAEGT